MPPEMAVVTPERESAALLFAERHHPELRGLLDRLKVNNPDQYEDAIADLFRTSERLAGLQARTPERYDLELEQLDEQDERRSEADQRRKRLGLFDWRPGRQTWRG